MSMLTRSTGIRRFTLIALGLLALWMVGARLARAQGLQPTPPYNVTATVDSGTIVVTWTRSCPGSFNVYRDGALYQQSVTTTSYTDSAVTYGVQYCYTVTTVNGFGQESSQSSESCATP